MKKSVLMFVVVAAAVLAVSTMSWGAGILGTAHDLSGKNWGSNQICIFCHTPHNANATPLAPLWNHGSSTATFTLYSSTTLNAVTGQPAGTSKACLSCHDGTVAIDTYGTTTGTNFITGGALVGKDLSGDHPVSFTYDAALATADGGLVTPVSASLVVPSIPLFSGKVECASCHDVHNDANGNFLHVSNASSALCLKCHIK